MKHNAETLVRILQETHGFLAETKERLANSFAKLAAIAEQVGKVDPSYVPPWQAAPLSAVTVIPKEPGTAIAKRHVAPVCNVKDAIIIAVHEMAAGNPDKCFCNRMLGQHLAKSGNEYAAISISGGLGYLRSNPNYRGPNGMRVRVTKNGGWLLAQVKT